MPRSACSGEQDGVLFAINSDLLMLTGTLSITDISERRGCGHIQEANSFGGKNFGFSDWFRFRVYMKVVRVKRKKCKYYKPITAVLAR